MPIERGQEWGWSSTATGEVPICANDAAVAEAVEAGVEIVRLATGDLARTLGVHARSPRLTSTWEVPVDALRVSLDEAPPIIAVAHVVVGRWIDRAGWCAVMNAAFIGVRNWAPRAHPGDGKADIVTCAVRGSDRLAARKRSMTGSHLPHPDIAIRRSESTTLEFDAPRAVRVDGQSVSRAQHIRFQVLPSAIVVAI